MWMRSHWDHIKNENRKEVKCQFWDGSIITLLTGDTFRVLLYVQLNRIFSAGSASTSQRTSIECIFMDPTDDCSVPGLHRGASVNVHIHLMQFNRKAMHFKINQLLIIIIIIVGAYALCILHTACCILKNWTTSCIILTLHSQSDRWTVIFTDFIFGWAWIFTDILSFQIHEV